MRLPVSDLRTDGYFMIETDKVYQVVKAWDGFDQVVCVKHVFDLGYGEWRPVKYGEINSIPHDTPVLKVSMMPVVVG